MKKTMMALLMAVLMAGLTACSSDTGETAGTTEGAAASAEETAAQETTAQETEAAETEGETEGTEGASGDGGEEVELTVFAAASMTETLGEISDLYAQVAPDVKLSFNFDSSGTLKTQIEEGAACDLFISAGQLQMDQLDIEADPSVNTDGLDYVAEGTRINLLENKVTLVTNEENTAGIASFDDLSQKLSEGGILMAMGNSDVPVGQYTQKILEYYGLDEEALAADGVITYGSNVKEVTTQVSEGVVDCGVVYCTDAFSAGLTVVDSATEEMCGQVIYPAAVMKNSANQEAAQAFLDYLTTDEAMAVFEAVGFSPAE